MGGGGNTFTGWALPPELDTTANGSYTAGLSIGAQAVTIVGLGTEVNEAGLKIQHTATISPTSIAVVKTR
jgi:hypothetical protein